MSENPTIAALQRRIADTEATLGSLRQKLAKALAKDAGTPAPICGLDLLWKAALPMSRKRSSKHLCRAAWNRLPKHERPAVADAIAALKAWNRCDEWRKNDAMFAPGLHRFISERKWEDLPEGGHADPLARYRCTAPKNQLVDPNDLVTDPASIRELLGLKPAAKPSPESTPKPSPESTNSLIQTEP